MLPLVPLGCFSLLLLWAAPGLLWAPPRLHSHSVSAISGVALPLPGVFSKRFPIGTLRCCWVCRNQLYSSQLYMCFVATLVDYSAERFRQEISDWNSALVRDFGARNLSLLAKHQD